MESTIGAADYPLHGGESIWWDYRDWGAAMRVPAVVGSWPQPFLGGYDGKRRPVAVECLGGGSACARLTNGWQEAGVERRPRSRRAARSGSWSAPGRGCEDDPAAAQVEDGPQASGVFADFHREGSATASPGSTKRATPRVDFGPDAGLVAATRRYEEPPVWLVTGASGGGRAAPPPACSTPPTCATITRWRSKGARRRRCRSR